MRVLLLVALAGCSSTASSRVPGQPAERAWPACYELRLGPWSRFRGFPRQVEIAPPPVIQLDTTHRPGVSDVRRRQLMPDLFDSTARGWRPAYWRTPSRDSVELVWGHGYGGLRVRLAQRGDSLIGEALAEIDSPAAGAATVTGWRVSCDRMKSAG